MANLLSSIEASFYRVFRHTPPQGKLHRVGFWLLIAFVALQAIAFLPGTIGSIGSDFKGWALFFLVVVYISIGCRWVFRHLLWKVRNRLIVTYLLMGLAPVVLFGTLALAAAYVFSGEFAIFAVTSEIHSELAHLASQNQAYAVHIGHSLEANPTAKSVELPELDAEQKQISEPGFEVAAYKNGKRILIERVQDGDLNLELPDWTAHRFSSIVVDKGKLYLRAFNIHGEAPNEVSVITSLPLSKKSADQIASGLGMVTLLPSVPFEEEEGSGSNPKRTPARDNLANPEADPGTVIGGKTPAKEYFYDLPIAFGAPISIFDWKTKKPHSIFISVHSEPSLLYRRLVIASLQGQNFYKNVFIGLAIFFAVLELIAFIMALRLNQTITNSIHDIYQATREVDRGNFNHRIPVRRNDQLAALSSSFNSMTSSLQGLLEEQREKERLQNELDIAQEVQRNLFPADEVSLPNLELHGVCRPARTVSGDYYDFLLFGKTGLGLALGDISGKGISAALLMATLHSAVRAYRFAGEELVQEGLVAVNTPRASSVDLIRGVDEIDRGEWFESPGKILALLNRHLYRSTQPEKYATLFLAHYNSDGCRLTYSNGGQLPPLLLRRDNSIARLDCGGTVVGLIDGMSYEEDTVVMKRGDILIAYSDGVTEPENEFGDFGEDRLLEIVRRNRFLPLPVICEQVMQALRDWIGAQEQPDDITLVLARQQ